jgi:hypothetical protein
MVYSWEIHRTIPGHSACTQRSTGGATNAAPVAMWPTKASGGASSAALSVTLLWNPWPMTPDWTVQRNGGFYCICLKPSIEIPYEYVRIYIYTNDMIGLTGHILLASVSYPHDTSI